LSEEKVLLERVCRNCHLSFVAQDVIYGYVRNALLENDASDVCTWSKPSLPTYSRVAWC